MSEAATEPTILVFVPARPGTPPPPDSRPLGRAALHLREEHGAAVLFAEVEHAEGDVVHALSPVSPTRWEEVRATPDAVYDRWPSQGRPEAWRAARARLPDALWGNGAALQRACRDKLATHQILASAGVPVPEMVDPADQSADSLHSGIPAGWTAAFAKPRYGAFGEGVTLLRAGDQVPEQLAGLQGGEPAVLQAAVTPWRPARQPDVWIAVRALAQWESGRWTCRTPVARISGEPVVNVSRGARVMAAAEVYGSDMLGGNVVGALESTAVAAASALAAATAGDARDLALEIGIDLIVDSNGKPWVIEANHKPRGHLAALAQREGRFLEEHIRASATPLVALAEAIREKKSGRRSRGRSE